MTVAVISCMATTCTTTDLVGDLGNSGSPAFKLKHPVRERAGGEGGKERSLRVCWRRGRKGKQFESVLEEREERKAV